MRPATLTLLVLLPCLMVTAAAADSQIFYDQATFEAVTGALNATGPLPNLGRIVTPSVTVGSVTFSLAPGGDVFDIGAIDFEPLVTDWYDPLPGNDIAMGYENLQVAFPTSVYSLGFVFAEPDVTMPAYGGIPMDTVFEITLFAGGVPIETDCFNAADDVVGFVGIWSLVPFDSAWIVDSTGNEDDEYFGEFFTGDIPLVEPLPGDANRDDLVSGADFTIWADFFGSGPCASFDQGDFNGDGFVTGADFTIWNDHFGESRAPATSVPEPATLLLVAVGLAFVACGRAGRRSPGYSEKLA